jgi:hypothetical protein
MAVGVREQWLQRGVTKVPAKKRYYHLLRLQKKEDIIAFSGREKK